MARTIPTRFAGIARRHARMARGKLHGHGQCHARARNHPAVRPRRRRSAARGLHGLPAPPGAAIGAQPGTGAGRWNAALGLRAALAAGGRLRVRLRAGGLACHGGARASPAARAGGCGRRGGGHGGGPSAHRAGARAVPPPRRRRRWRWHAAGTARAPAATGLVPARCGRGASAAVEAGFALAPAAAGPGAARSAQPGHQRRGNARVRRPHRRDGLCPQRRRAVATGPAARHRCLARPDVDADRGQHAVAHIALRACARARRYAGARRCRLDDAARGGPHPPDRDLGFARRAGGERDRLAGVRDVVVVADAGARTAAHARRGDRGGDRCARLRRGRGLRAADDAHRADDLAGGAGAAAAPRPARRGRAGDRAGRDAGGRPVVRALAGFLAQLRRRRVAALVPAGRWRARLARAPRRILRGAGRRDDRPVAAHRHVVRAGLAGRAGREHGRHSLVEPRGGSARARGHGAGSAACRVRRMALAARGMGVRPAVGRFRIDRAQPARAVVVAGTRVVRGAARTRGCRLAAAAARRAGQAAGLAVVAAVAVAPARTASARRSGGDGDRRRAGALGAGPHRIARAALRHRAGEPGRVRRRRRCRGARVAGAGRARTRCDRAQPRRQRPHGRLSLGRRRVSAAPAMVAGGHASGSLRATRRREGAAARGLPRGQALGLGWRRVPLPASAALVPVLRQRFELRVARTRGRRRDAAAAGRCRRCRRAHAGARRARRDARRCRARRAPRQPELVGSRLRRCAPCVLGPGVGRRPQPLRPSRSGRGGALARRGCAGRGHRHHRRADPAAVRDRRHVHGRAPPAPAPVGAKPVS